MDKLNQYRQCIRTLLTEYASYQPAFGEVEVETVFDAEHDHYQLVNIGWEDELRVYGCSVHIDIKDGKVWLQHNLTDRRIAHELIAAGISAEDIVLGFQPPYKRRAAEYG